jgi:putative membrane protein
MIEYLPAVNASLNATTAVLLTTGLVFIRKKNIPAHRRCMLSAIILSTIFLASYITYHSYHGITYFPDIGWPKTLYRTILFTHTILAMTLLPLIIITATRALRENFERHKLIARWTWPIWMYVSVTGVIVYWMLYHLFPTK